ncbi:hypothetical protein OZX62_03990 [Bifidobacterium sp. ESL0690]|uniref:hypothetical protein n=1 Tax=Bifidobacterium sp. ESL0690 TaxID=2983214 RepID=UPI0023F83A44|nr:hypothetical protein [Bifidobacterium sp. ESL0690]WEV47435.1 hypothetical protein OZX62_03990 [Bifidobacterium sp. ESL0690]
MMIDDMRDPIRRTAAAQRYFEELNGRFDALSGSWEHDHREFTECEGSTPLTRASGQCEVAGQLMTCISAALESLNLSILLYRSDPNTVVTAHYSVIRTAVEASSTGIWLGTTGGENKMRFKSLKLAYRDNENLMAVAMRDKHGNRDLLENRRAKRRRLEEEFAALDCARGKDIARFPHYTQIIRDADGKMRGKGDRRLLDGQTSWRMCSGSAHGSRDVLIGSGLASPTGAGDEKTEEVSLQRDPWNTVSCMFPALENCERLIDLYRRGQW